MQNNTTTAFEQVLAAFCAWDLRKNPHGNYIDEKTQYAWEEYSRINSAVRSGRPENLPRLSL